MAGRALVGILLAATSAHAATMQADVRGGVPAFVRLESPVDDAHLANPPGYAPAERPAARVVTRIVIANTGTSPIANPDLRLNGRPLLPVADPLAVLGLKVPFDLLELFGAWRDRRVHATTGLDANRDPLEVLRVIGGTFCGDDARALGAITIPHGSEVRFVPLNGHSAGEHRRGIGEWALLDGDQGAFYLRWDNRTPASAADLLEDPLLVLRTKIYGRHSTWTPPTAWQNLARFEFVEVGMTQKTLRLKRPPATPDWELLPGETLAIDFEKTPDRAFGASEGMRKNAALREVGCVVEFHIDAAARAARGGRVRLPFPEHREAAGEPIYEVAAATDHVLCYAARAHFPTLRAGENELVWQGRGALRVSFETREIPHRPVAAPIVHAPGTFDGFPRFALAEASGDRVWWQISGERNFRAVPPNFDVVREFAAEIGLDGPLDETLLSPGHDYYFRAKIRRAGVWSDWSEPLAFTVRKPAQPRLRTLERLADGRVRLRWVPGTGEMAVFGSDRVDFLPEIFGEIEPTRIENNVLLEGRKNRNLLATVPAESGEVVVPARAAYRLIVTQAGVRSVPSALARVEGMPARVLQNRHLKPAGELVGRDVAVEMPVP